MAPMATSKEGRVAADEDTVARPTVRFPGYRHEEKDPDKEDLNLEDIPVTDAAASELLSLDTNEYDESRKSHIEDSVAVTPSLKTHKDFSCCKDRTDELLEGLCKKDTDLKDVPATMTLPPEIHKEDLLAGQEEVCSSRIPITESRYIRPLLRLPSRDNRPYRLDGQRLVRDPKTPTIISKEDWIDMDEDVARSTVRFPVDRNGDISTTRELDRLSDELNDEIPCRSRMAITDDQYIRLPSAHSPMNDFRISRLSDDGLFIEISEVPTNTSKNQITMDEGILADGPVVVRLPERQDLVLSRTLPPSLLNVEKTKEDTEDTKKGLHPCLFLIDSVEETRIAETALNEEVGELNNHRDESHSFRISVDSGIDYEDQNEPKDVTQEKSQILDLNIPSIELTDILGDALDDKVDDFDHTGQLDIQTGIVDDPYSFNLPLFVECAYNLEVCLPFSSALKKDMRVHLMDGIGYQLVDPAYQLVIPPTCPCGMEIAFFNDISPDTGWCQFPIDNNYTFSANRRDRTWKDLSEGTWNFANYEDRNSHGVSSDDKTGGRDNVFDCERDKLEAFFPFDWIQAPKAAGARKRETDMGSSTDAKGKNLDYGLIGSPELFDWTFEGYPRTDLPDRTYHGILTTRAASEKNSSLVELLFRFLPTVLVNTVGSTCDSRGTAAMLRVFTWKDTGWYSQFLRIQYFAWAPRFPSIEWPRVRAKALECGPG